MVGWAALANRLIYGILAIYLTMFIIALFAMLLAIFEKSTGFRQLYVDGLLLVFKWTNGMIADAREKEMNQLTETSSDDDETDGIVSTSTNFIERDATKRMIGIRDYGEHPTGDIVQAFFEDSLDFIKAGVESVIEDDVTSRFRSAEMTTWNLLTRSSYGYHLINWKLTLFWMLGLVFRYFVLFPINISILVMALAILICFGTLIALMPESEQKLRSSRRASLICYRILLQACSGHVTFHNRENMAKPGGICVANHTSPIDALILASNNCYALVGQKQDGFLGFVQNCLSRLDSHIWFQREETFDKLAVRQRLLDHVQDSDKLPILIFPEGTCINNTSVMMFKKGSFEVCNTIYPVAIKYDGRFGDAFWNSSKTSYFEYLMLMLTSWALVCDVWYLPPMSRLIDEDGIAFAARVKKAIAIAGGLVDLEWDGQLKRYPVRDDAIENQRKLYSQKILKMENKGASSVQ